ncbi:unnamed protein product [Phytophthora fragariaefolia]|uniref:Unnamed protein product n=1 Tax=Phytophthora fragariaefolia TaxID=1490495 RepID=A0A9W7CP72_9STRA|nr:unnamed protein product [Phytophthora fragariaefolia]
MTQSSERNRARLQLIEQKLLKRCSQAKEDVNVIRMACVSERAQIESLRDNVCLNELPKLLTLLENRQARFDIQRQQLEIQTKSQAEDLQSQVEQLQMSRQDVEQRVLRLQEKNHQDQLKYRKLQQRAVLHALTARKCKEFQRRTFSAWKELHLRSLVGQVTHTAMVFQSQKPHTFTIDSFRPSCTRYVHQQPCPATAAGRPPSMVLDLLQPEVPKFDDCLRSSACPVTPIDSMWRKWRRVDGGIASRGHRPRPPPNLPS